MNGYSYKWLLGGCFLIAGDTPHSTSGSSCTQLLIQYLTQQCDEAIETERNAAVRRRTELQRFEQVRKLGDCGCG
jgi:hypothetical protein